MPMIELVIVLVFTESALFVVETKKIVLSKEKSVLPISQYCYVIKAIFAKAKTKTK